MRARRAGTLVMTLLATLGVACAASRSTVRSARRSPVDRDAGTTTPGTFVLPSRATEVYLVSAGEGEALRLRYALVPGTTDTVDTTTDLTIDLGIFEAAATAKRQSSHDSATARVAVAAVTDGGARVVTTIDDPRAELEQTVDRRGLGGPRRLVSNITDATSAAELSEMESLSHGMIALPREPVGTGGRWQVVTRETMNGIDTQTTTTYALKSRHGDELAVEGEISVTAAPQRVRGTRDPTELVLLAGHGKVELAVDLRRPTAYGSRDVTIDSKMIVNGVEVTLVSVMHVERGRRGSLSRADGRSVRSIRAVDP